MKDISAFNSVELNLKLERPEGPLTINPFVTIVATRINENNITGDNAQQQQISSVESQAVAPNNQHREFESLDTFTKGVTNTNGVSAGNATINPISDNFYSSLRTRSVVEPDYIYTKKPKISSVDPKLRMEYEKILNKPFFVENCNWGDDLLKGDIIREYNIPYDILNNELSKYPFITSVLYRAKISLIFQVAGTPMHQGTVIASAGPYTNSFPAVREFSINRMMAAPHVFLSANESTPVRLQVPFYSPTKLMYCNIPSDALHYNDRRGYSAQVNLKVLNPLAKPDTSAKSVTISVHAVFDDLDFFVPHISPSWEKPATFVAEGLGEVVSSAIDGVFSVGKRFTRDLLDTARGAIRKYTGLHNPNNPRVEHKVSTTMRQTPNNVDSTTTFEKMDPYSDFARITQDYLFDTDVDEMDMSQLLTKPYYLDTFVVNTSDKTGTTLFSRPISPFQQGLTPRKVESIFHNGSGTPQLLEVIPFDIPLQAFYMLSRFWRGSINIHIQSNMSNFHFCKLAVARNYAPETPQQSNFPVYSSIQNLMVETMEFSGGGQVQTVKLPFISQFDMNPCVTDYESNQFNGVYYIYLAQPLVTNGSVATTVQFNIYLSAGEDFQYYGYATNPMYQIAATNKKEEEQGFVAEAAAMQPVSDQSSITNPGFTGDDPRDEFMRPICNVRDYSRRMYRTFRKKITNDTLKETKGVFALDVNDLITNPVPVPQAGNTGAGVVNPIGLLRSLFLGYQGGIKFKVVVTGTTNAQAWYVPPGYSTGGLDRIPGATQQQINASCPIITGPGTPPITVTGINTMYDIEYDDEIFSTSWSSPSVVVERPNYVVPCTTATTHGVGNEKSVLMGVSILEGHIPNLSPYRFVGTGLDLNGLTSTSDYYLPTRNLGFLVISMGEPALLAPGVANDPTQVELSVFVSTDDEARFGFQVNAPVLALPTCINKEDKPVYMNSNNYFVDYQTTAPVIAKVNPATVYYTKRT